jgi:two-component system chemotaxis sensor kinase CheA
MDDVLRQVVGVFADEVKEQAQKIASALLAMESDPSLKGEHIEELFRQAHSLKGSSASLGVEELERLGHNLEEALMPLRRGRGTLTPLLVDTALRAMDAARMRADGLVADNEVGREEVKRAAIELITLAERGEGVIEGAGESDSVNANVNASVNVNANESVNVNVNAGENVNANANADVRPDDGETLRVAAARLHALERRLDELRSVRGRLDQRAAATTALIQAMERLWREARDSRVAPDELYQLLRQLGALRRDLYDDAELAQANAVELDENLRAMRMVPAALVEEPLTRAVREACRRTGKEARLDFRGGDAQIDRRLLEELKNPLLHLVRNAVDHGVEGQVVREAVGKPTRATISVSFEQRGRDVRLEVRDDGRGVDLLQVRKKAVERQLYSEEEAARLSDGEAQDLLFRPGFSTAAEVTELSGRGVGLDVVRDAVLRLHGRIELRSEPGQGTMFLLSLPLTVAASELMLIEEGGRPFALPLSSIERIVRARDAELRTVGGRTLYHLDDQPIPVVRLARVLGLAERHEGTPFRTLAVVRGGPSGERAAVVCELLLGSRDLVLRPLPPELQSLRLLANAAILPNGQAIFTLSPRALVEAANELRPAPAPAPKGLQRYILVADDSITTRALVRNALEASGFRVRTAADGDEAFRLALAEPFDLVVSDVRMPRLDGFGLTARLRAHPRTARIPVVLFSSLDSEEDKRRGSQSGANAYLTKGAFDRGHLLDVVANLIRGS